MKFSMDRLSRTGPRLARAALLVILCAPSVLAQTQGANGAGAATDGEEPPAARLYVEASQYVKRKFDEFRATNVPYDKQLDERTRREQRDLALRNATRLAALPPAHPLDTYYLGMLYALAEKPEEASAAMRRLLSEAGTRVPAETLDDARAVLIQQLLKAGRAAEAEKVLADYTNAPAQKPLLRYRYETSLATHYRDAKRFDLAAPRAREAYRAVLAAAPSWKPTDLRMRDSLLYGSASVAADTLARAGRREESVALVRDLQRLAFSLPSARLYAQATEMFDDYDAPREAPAAPPSASSAPELLVNQWIEQQPTSLAGLRGQVVLLDFWATWCGPCRVQMPRLAALQRKYGRRGLVVLGLTTYQGRGDGREMSPAEELVFLRQFKRRVGAAYGFAVTDTDVNEENYGVASFPTTVLLDRRGRVRLISVGAAQGGEAALEAAIRRLLDEGANEVTSDK